MKIAVIGAGAIGSLVAGYLTKAGEDVTLIGRKDQVDAVNKNGLRIVKHDGQETIAVKAKTKLDQEYTLVIFATKTQDIEEAYQDNKEFLTNPYQIVLTTQNGVQADNMISCHFEPMAVISSIVMFGSTYVKPGEVTFNFPGDWIIGKPFSTNDTKVTDVERVLSKAFPVIVTQEIVGMKWLKLFVNFNNCIPAMVGKSMQETFSDMDFCRLSILLLKEGLEIVSRAGIEIVCLPKLPSDRIKSLAAMPLNQAAGIINKTLTGLSKEPLYGSILQSIMRKKLSEIDFINGEVVMLAKGIGREAPLNTRVIELVHQVENEGKFLDPEFVKREFNLSEAQSYGTM
ncbi:MAG: hypothetical protein A2Z88_03920 [Omnitrophica WOR_2 bacterium GWA2_47_8]|nr:MAG: hypothetical protein A2Z88_03920 [Omnitrophica WOR_2 bacterium GWA2_47_8]